MNRFTRIGLRKDELERKIQLMISQKGQSGEMALLVQVLALQVGILEKFAIRGPSVACGQPAAAVTTLTLRDVRCLTTAASLISNSVSPQVQHTENIITSGSATPSAFPTTLSVSLPIFPVLRKKRQITLTLLNISKRNHVTFYKINHHAFIQHLLLLLETMLSL